MRSAMSGVLLFGVVSLCVLGSPGQVQAEDGNIHAAVRNKTNLNVRIQVYYPDGTLSSVKTLKPGEAWPYFKTGWDKSRSRQGTLKILTTGKNFPLNFNWAGAGDNGNLGKGGWILRHCRYELKNNPGDGIIPAGPYTGQE